MTTTNAKSLPALHAALLTTIIAGAQTNAQIQALVAGNPGVWAQLQVLADQGLVAMNDSIGWTATPAGQEWGRTIAGKP